MRSIVVLIIRIISIPALIICAAGYFGFYWFMPAREMFGMGLYFILHKTP